MRMVDAEYKLEKNIKIAMLYLEDDDAVNAETFIKKAASLITGTKVLTMMLTYPLCILTCEMQNLLHASHIGRISDRNYCSCISGHITAGHL